MRIYTEKEHVSIGWLAQNGLEEINRGSDENGAWIDVEEENAAVATMKKETEENCV